MPRPHAPSPVPIGAHAAMPADNLVGRDDLIAQIESLLGAGRDVLLLGPPDVGKTAVILALAGRGFDPVMVVDPFEHVTPRVAAAIRRGSDRAVQYLAATRSVDRAHLGAVRRIAWRFTTVRVPPLPLRLIRRVIAIECATVLLPEHLARSDWGTAVGHLAQGRPGLAIAIVRAAAGILERSGALPSPRLAYVDARMRSAGVIGVSASERR